MDNKIIEKIKQGDELAFELLFRKYYGRLCGFANKFIGSSTESEEIVQEVFLNIWNRKEKLKLNEEIRSYLFKSVQNLCFNYIQHQKIVDKYYSAIEIAYKNQTDDFNTYESVLYNELQTKVDEAISTLPKACRRIFKMSRVEGLKYAEIAQKLNISVKTVETQMGRALVKLRLALKDYLPILIIILLLNR